MTEQEIDALALEYEKTGNNAFVHPSHLTSRMKTAKESMQKIKELTKGE